MQYRLQRAWLLSFATTVMGPANDSAAGRQQNRRVEVVLSNPPAAGRQPPAALRVTEAALR
jgi:hypothetical protein